MLVGYVVCEGINNWFKSSCSLEFWRKFFLKKFLESWGITFVGDLSVNFQVYKRRIWVKIFKNGPSKIWKVAVKKIWSDVNFTWSNVEYLDPFRALSNICDRAFLQKYLKSLFDKVLNMCFVKIGRLVKKHSMPIFLEFFWKKNLNTPNRYLL